jgi:glycerol-3-phosphate dehydrogenase
MIRLGLWGYDLLAGRGSLPRSSGVAKGDSVVRDPLKRGFRLASYWDAWVDDARLVVLNAVDAAERGAEIATRTALISARRAGGAWIAELSGGRRIEAGMIVNAAGPWVADVLNGPLPGRSRSSVRLVKGSHILVPRLWDGEHSYILQQERDGRVVFALPYGSCSLIGTTDVPVARPDDAAITSDEIDYLCAAANAYFLRPTRPSDLVWAYSGVRALYDDGSTEAKDVTRDYRLELDPEPGPKLLSVFGGKITTARALALEALDRLQLGGFKFTATTPLPGGDLTPAFNAWLEAIGRWMPPALLKRLSRGYGTRLDRVLNGAESLARLGRHFGAGLYEAEVRYLVETEFAQSADDILWRRTKLGLELKPHEKRQLERYLGR